MRVYNTEEGTSRSACDEHRTFRNATSLETRGRAPILECLDMKIVCDFAPTDGRGAPDGNDLPNELVTGFRALGIKGRLNSTAKNEPPSAATVHFCISRAAMSVQSAARPLINCDLQPSCDSQQPLGISLNHAGLDSAANEEVPEEQESGCSCQFDGYPESEQGRGSPRPGITTQAEETFHAGTTSQFWSWSMPAQNWYHVDQETGCVIWAPCDFD